MQETGDVGALWQGLELLEHSQAWYQGRLREAQFPHGYSGVSPELTTWAKEPGGLQSMGSLRVGRD